MNIAEIFIRRPVMTALVMMAILIFGIMGYRLLPVSDLPNVDFPTILVSASLPGATPKLWLQRSRSPWKDSFPPSRDSNSMTSTSQQGGTSITLQFSLSRSLDGAAQDVQAMIAESCT